MKLNTIANMLVRGRSGRCLVVFFLAFVMPIIAFAVPVKRGQWWVLPLADGTKVRAELCGDERVRWWQADDGSRYVAEGKTGLYKAMEKGQAASLAKSFQTAVASGKMAKVVRRAQQSAAATFQGGKRGLIILAQFPDQTFSYNNVRALYDRIANEQGYSDHNFNGSISDYFSAQSGGQFTLNFDVAGPVTMSHNYSYYGDNDEANAPEMIKEACQGVDSLVNFANYDWDGDGEVEEVFVLYAGHGQADYDSNNDDLIWPHMYYVNPTGYASNDFYLDGVKIDVYACSSELNGDGYLAGIGTFCHEFSHCMGFPDMYDTGDAGNFGMGSWDLMDYGSYNGDGYTPAGYSGYEKMVCGWTNPVELTGDTTIASMQPMSQMGQSYIVYNKGNRNEYYILTNRQQSGYDASIPGHGMIIEHIDYNKNIWDYNLVNTTDNTDYASYGITNDHQRITIFHADNKDGFYDQSRDAYPYYGKDSLTNNSLPAATTYNANSDGTKYMNCAIRDITENSDGSMSFVFGGGGETSSDANGTLAAGVIFKETFDKCNGTGGNDGVFKGLSSSTSTFKPDNSGWSGTILSGGSKCAWFGNGSTAGQAITPAITFTGDTLTLTFRAAGWGAKKDGTSLDVGVYSGNAQLLDSSVLTLTKESFDQFTIRMTGSGTVKLEFLGAARFFLDDVMVLGNTSSSGSSTGISTIKVSSGTAKASARRVYTLSGQYVGDDISTLPHGVYIVGGRKIVK